MKRLLCLTVLLCLLAGCADTPGTTWVEQFDHGGAETAVIAYVPLDNRPVNTTRVAFLAQSAGFRLLMPETDLYRTALDGQSLNANGTQYGDGEALLGWIERTDADYYVVSLDQILSGGLVNSRWMTEITDEYEKMDRLLEALTGKQAILFDTVMRLAPTVGYGGYTLSEYEALREYGKIPRPLLSGELTIDQVVAGYDVPTDLDEAVLSKYLAARSRKLRLSRHFLSAVSRAENILVYYGIDDSSPEDTIQTNEIKFIEQNLQNGYVFAGTDEMGLMAVARTIRNHYSGQPLPRVGIRYFGAVPDAPADPYDAGTLESNIAAHLEALGIVSEPDACDLELLVFGGEEPAGILERCKENSRKGLPTVIVDLGEDFALPQAMLADAGMDFTYLLGYSSWNTAGNSVGIGLASGIARYLYLRNESSPVNGANSGFLKGLALSFAKDISFAQSKPQLDPKEQKQALEMVQKGTALGFERFAAMLEGKAFLTSLAPLKTGTMPAFSVAALSFPWDRTFEAELEIQIG